MLGEGWADQRVRILCSVNRGQCQHAAQRELELEVELLVIEEPPHHFCSSLEPLFSSFLPGCTGCNPVGSRHNCQQSDVRVSAMTATVPPLFGPDMLANPNATYARIRGPVSWNEQLGLWLVTRYHDVRWALGDPRLSSTLATPADHRADGSAHLLADMYTFVQSSLVFTDPPDHTRLRRPTGSLSRSCSQTSSCCS